MLPKGDCASNQVTIYSHPMLCAVARLMQQYETPAANRDRMTLSGTNDARRHRLIA